MSTHSSPTLWRNAAASAYLRAARGSRSAMVFDPVPAPASLPAVTASILSLSLQSPRNWPRSQSAAACGV